MNILENYCVFIRNGANIKNSKDKLGIPITRIETISDSIIDKNKYGYADIFDNKYEDYYLKKNDILMSHINSLKHLGKTAFCEEDKEVIHGMNLLCIRSNDKINPKYLNYYFKSNDFYKKLMKISKQSVNQSSFAVSDLRKIEIVVLDREIQNTLVKRLEKVEQLINIRRQQIVALDNLVKSQFVEMFGDPIINEKCWKKKKLANECNIITGNTPSRSKKEYYGDYIEWIKSDNINTTSNYITKAEEYLSKEGLEVGRSIRKDSILMTCIAGSISCIGNVAMTDRKVCFNQQINGIETLNNNTLFMYIQFILSKQYIQSTINMSLKGILSKGKLSELEFIFPPIELQNQFAGIVKQIDKQKFEIQKSLKETEELKESLMNKYFG